MELRLRRRCARRPSLGRAALSVETLCKSPEECGVAFGLREAVQQELNALVGADRGQHPAHGPDHLERSLLEEELLAAGAGALDVDGREDPLLRELPIED